MGAVTDDTTAVLPVLFDGRAVDLSSIRVDPAERGIVVIEDAARAFALTADPQRRRRRHGPDVLFLWLVMSNLLAVCLGNHCRSPFAQLALARRADHKWPSARPD
ncbi:DegT/DnrJ/EryC1/StrS family aminotransferase [Streptomyces anulatus]